jgi:hypothetical protein
MTQPINTNTVTASTYTSSLNAASSQNAIAQLDALMVSIPMLYAKMRDTELQYTQVAAMNTYKMAITAFDSGMDSVHKDFKSKMASSGAGIASGALQMAGGFASPMGAYGELSIPLTQGIGHTTESAVATGMANPLELQGQQDKVCADYQGSMEDNLQKNLSQTQSLAQNFSSSMADVLQQLVQLHQSIAQAVKIN